MAQPNANVSSGLERTVHICVIAVCLVSLALLLERRFLPNGSAPSAASSEKALVGEHIEIAGLDWRSSPMNAVLYMNTRCHFCQESTPFYREITDAQRSRRAGVSLSVLSAESPEVMREYLTKKQIVVDGVYKLSSPVPALTGTPTWLIIDAGGIVRQAFIGKLNGSKEKELLKIVQAGTT
jgi:hypothetical protein